MYFAYVLLRILILLVIPIMNHYSSSWIYPSTEQSKYSNCTVTLEIHFHYHHHICHFDDILKQMRPTWPWQIVIQMTRPGINPGMEAFIRLCLYINHCTRTIVVWYNPTFCSRHMPCFLKLLCSWMSVSVCACVCVFLPLRLNYWCDVVWYRPHMIGVNQVN